MLLLQFVLLVGCANSATGYYYYWYNWYQHSTTTRPPTLPPATNPPATNPPPTLPPATYPPATYPPATYPPATYPPATYPPYIPKMTMDTDAPEGFFWPPGQPQATWPPPATWPPAGQPKTVWPPQATWPPAGPPQTTWPPATWPAWNPAFGTMDTDAPPVPAKITLFPPPSTIPPTTTTSGPPGPGVWTGPECFNLDMCMECMCGVESNEEARGCADELPATGGEMCMQHMLCNKDFHDVNMTGPCICGSWQISEEYVTNCSSGVDYYGNNYTLPMTFTHFWECAVDIDCATQCVKNYIDKYRFECTGMRDPDSVSCVDNWRIHRGGPSGCKQPQNWEASVDSCCGTPALGCVTEESCLAFICGLESNEGYFRCGREFGFGYNCSLSNCNGRGNVEVRDPATETCYCGAFQITEEYFRDCTDPEYGFTVPLNDFNKCAGNANCATQCTRNYIERYKWECLGKNNTALLSCEEKAVIHRPASLPMGIGLYCGLFICPGIYCGLFICLGIYVGLFIRPRDLTMNDPVMKTL